MHDYWTHEKYEWEKAAEVEGNDSGDDEIASYT